MKIEIGMWYIIIGITCLIIGFIFGGVLGMLISNWFHPNRLMTEFREEVIPKVVKYFMAIEQAQAKSQPVESPKENKELTAL